MSPFLSIIIPFYGSADRVLLERCVASIRKQGMEEGSYEIILAQDNSQTTGGARNSGLLQAQGEYILFVDSDDLLMPDALPSCLALLKRQSPDILRFGFREFSRHLPSRGRRSPGTPLSYQSYPSGGSYMLRHNFTGVVWAHFYRRAFLEQYAIRFTETSHFDDEEFVAKAYFFSGPMLLTPFEVYAYYRSPSSLTLDATEEQCRKRIVAFKEMIDRLIAFKSIVRSAPHLNAGIKGLNRRIHFLTIDYIRQMRRNKLGIREMNRELALLKRQDLLPLPAEPYSWKYRLVRLVVNAYIRMFV